MTGTSDTASDTSAAQQVIDAAPPRDERRRVTVFDMGRVAYAQAFALQSAVQAARIDGRCGDVLLLCEHEPVFTVTRHSPAAHRHWDDAECARRGIGVETVDRGGDITYHGPGQLVGYPILALRDYRRDIRWYVTSLEQLAIRTLARYGLAGGRDAKHRGVWVEPSDARDGVGGKVCAIGVRLSHWVTKHGFALNHEPDLAHYAGIVPCGIHDRPVTSIRALLGDDTPTLDQVTAAVREEFACVFEASIVEASE